MKSFNTEVAKHAKKTRLSAAERSELRERIFSYMEYHPLPKQSGPVAVRPSASRTRWEFLSATYARVAAGAFAFVFILAGIPLVAERAVPGDILYPIKTQVNEQFRSQFVDSPYEKIAFETELMERRIAEARLLEKEGKLSPEVEAEIAEAVKGHATAAWAGIAELNASDAEEGAIAKLTFGSALDVQSAIFADDGEAETETGIEGVVRAARASVDADRSTTTPSYTRLSARVELETTRAHELATSVNGSATEEERAKIDRRLGDIERKIASAREAQEAEGDTEGVEVLSVALTDIQKLISFMTDIDVRENVALDTLVPVVLTPEERIAVLREGLPELEEGEAYDEQSATLAVYITRAEELLAGGNIRDAEKVITEAEIFVKGEEGSLEIEGEVEVGE